MKSRDKFFKKCYYIGIKTKEAYIYDLRRFFFARAYFIGKSG